MHFLALKKYNTYMYKIFNNLKKWDLTYGSEFLSIPFPLLALTTFAIFQ